MLLFALARFEGIELIDSINSVRLSVVKIVLLIALRNPRSLIHLGLSLCFICLSFALCQYFAGHHISDESLRALLASLRKTFALLGEILLIDTFINDLELECSYISLDPFHLFGDLWLGCHSLGWNYLLLRLNGDHRLLLIEIEFVT